MGNETTPKEIMLMSLNGNRRHVTALATIEDPLDYEVRDLDNVTTLYEKYPYIPFFQGADATLRFYARMRKLSPTQNSIINALIHFIFGGKMTVVKNQTSGFSSFDETEEEATKEEWEEYVSFIKEHLNPGELLESMKQFYDGFKTWGNGWIEVVLTTVAGEKFVKIHVHDSDRCRYMIPVENMPMMVGISPEWTCDFLNKYPPEVIPVYPAFAIYEDGTQRTIIHKKNKAVQRNFYGEPDSIGGVFFQYLEYQLGAYTTEGYQNRWIARVMFETYSDDENNNANQDFDLALIDTFTQKGKNRKTVVHRNAASDSQSTKVYEFKPQTDEGFHTSMADIAETQILKAHNWNHLLLGVKIAGSLGNGTEYAQVYKRKFYSKIKPEMEMVLEPFREALMIIEDFVGYDNPKKLTIGLKDIYYQMIEDSAIVKDSAPLDNSEESSTE